MKRVCSIVLGLSLIFAGIEWLSMNERESEEAAASAALAVPVLQEQILMKETKEAIPEAVQKLEMTEVEVDGRFYIGVLEIPQLKLELPILSSWSEANAKIAPCRYSGTSMSNDLIICAHNYKSHFGRLPALAVGDMVTFTDVEGTCTAYLVSNLEVLDGTALDQMESGDWDLTLFTCTAGGKKRFAVRCMKDKICLDSPGENRGD